MPILTQPSHFFLINPKVLIHLRVTWISFDLVPARLPRTDPFLEKHVSLSPSDRIIGFHPSGLPLTEDHSVHFTSCRFWVIRRSDARLSTQPSIDPFLIVVIIFVSSAVVSHPLIRASLVLGCQSTLNLKYRLHSSPSSSSRMFPDLPEHLQTLNTLSPSPPSGGMTQEYEDAVWKYLNTDDVFNNLGTIPSDMQAKEEVPTPAPTQAKAPSDLKSFVAQFAREAALPLPLPYNVTASSSAAPNPLANGVNTLDIMPLSSSTPWEDETSEDGRISGAKKLKQIGAGTGEIEEEYVLITTTVSDTDDAFQ